MDISRQQQLAESAKQLLENEVFNMAFENVNNEIAGQIVKTPPEARETREQLYFKFKYGQEFVQNIHSFVARFKAAEALEEQGNG